MPGASCFGSDEKDAEEIRPPLLLTNFQSNAPLAGMRRLLLATLMLLAALLLGCGGGAAAQQQPHEWCPRYHLVNAGPNGSVYDPSGPIKVNDTWYVFAAPALASTARPRASTGRARTCCGGGERVPKRHSHHQGRFAD
jgi:hypothetical protein